MDDIVPIVSIISGAAVAILVPLVTAAAHSGEKKREHDRERSAALRETLVKCCTELAEVSTAAVNAARRVDIKWGTEPSLPDANDSESSFLLFRTHLLAVYKTSLVLVLELGPDSPVFTTYRKCVKALNGLQRPLLEARSTSDKDEVEEKIHDGLRTFFDTEAKFHKVASDLLIEREENERALISIRDRLPRIRWANAEARA